MSARTVTSRLSRHFWPPLVEDGFVKFQTREYDRIRCATVNAVRIQPIANTWAGYEHVASGSFLVQLGAHHTATELGIDPENAYNPGDLGVCNIRCDVTTPPALSDPDPRIWDLAHFESVDAAIETLLEEFERQGLSFFETWSDPASALSELGRMPALSEASPTGGESHVVCTGAPGSPSRLQALATLAARAGDVEQEKGYLREAIQLRGGSELQRRRLKEIER